jgi:hypothetical protein
MKLLKYKIYCTTSNAWEYIWLEDTAAVPTLCPADPGHSVQAGSVSIDATVEQAPVSATGMPLVEATLHTGPVGSKSISIVTPDLGDKTTWYQKSVQVVDEVLTDSGDGLTFNSVNPHWINIDSPRLTYTHKQIPKRDGTYGKHADWRTVVKVNDVVQSTSTYTQNFAAGTITFNSSKAGDTVKATYWHINGVTNHSEWLLTPPAGKRYAIEHVEMQFSQNTNLTDTVRFEIWAGASLGTYGSFPDYLWEAGYGQFRADYRGIIDFINAANEGKSSIPACGGLTQDVLVMPFNYVQAITMNSTQGTLFRLCLLNNTPFTNSEIVTATFYLQVI